ncbi:hypothetical protein BH23ACT11_BH23ACT11_06090 [soil metagenome]
MSEGGFIGDELEGVEWEHSADLTDVSKEGLSAILSELVQQEREVSYQRRILQGRIDLIRSELVRRGEASLSPEELARVLMDKGGGGPKT